MQQANSLRVATYTRISTDEEHQPFSLEAQAQRLDAYVSSQEGWSVVHRFTDQMTGSSLERSGLQSALRAARAGLFDLLLVYRVDRLSRSVRGLAQILEELDRAKVHFRSATEPFDTASAAGRMMVQMLGVFAEFERATLIDRVVAGMERKAAKGGWLGGLAPYGYRLNADAGRLEPDPAEAALIPVIFDLYLRRRLGTRAIAHQLNGSGERTRSGRLWCHLAVRKILLNPVYAGLVHFRGVAHPGPHEALISDEVASSARELMARRGDNRSERRSNSSDYLLSGLLRCRHCGSHFVGTVAHGHSRPYRYYTCFRRQRYGRRGCTADRLPAQQLDRAVIDALSALLADTDLLERALQKTQRRSEDSRSELLAELQRLMAKRADVDAALERYFTAFEHGRLPEQLLAERVKRLHSTIQDLATRIAEVQLQLATVDQSPPTSAKGLTELYDVFVSAEPQQLKPLLKLLTARIDVDSRQSIQPTFRIPTDPGAVRIVDGVVGRGRLELPTSALSARRSAS